MSDSGSSLVWAKEKEWRELLESRMQKLEEENRVKDAELREEREKLNKLKEDFKYNLRLLKERDKELANYDRQLLLLKDNLSASENRVSEVSIELDGARTEMAATLQTKEELQRELQQCLNKRYTEVDQLRREKETEIVRLREEHAAVKRKLEMDVVRITAELESQKHALLTDVGNELRKKDEESQSRTEEMTTQILSYELKYRLLEKELEAIRESRATVEDKMTEKDAKICELEMKVNEVEIKMSSELSLVNCDKDRLNQQLLEKERQISKLQDELERKQRKFDMSIAEKEEALRKGRTAFEEEVNNKVENCKSLSEKVEHLEHESKHLEWQHKEELKEKNFQIEQLIDENGTLRVKIESLERRAVDSVSNRDGEYRSLRLEMEKLREQLRRFKEDNARLQDDLEHALEKEGTLVQQQAQNEIDWQRKAEEIEYGQMNKVEGLIRQLSAARDEALAKCKECEKTVEQKNMFIQSLIRDRDIAIKTLKDSGLPFNRNSDFVVPGETEERLRELEGQNENLRQVIARMSEELKQQAAEVLQKDEQISRPPGDPSSSLDLEDSKVHRPSKRRLAAETEIDPNSKHIADLANSASKLRKERIELVAQCRKQQSRIEHLEVNIESLHKEIREKQTVIDKLEYQHNSAQRHSGVEVDSRRRRIVELEMQLAEAQKEADEYYKGNIELTRINEDIQKELTSLRAAKPASVTPDVYFGAQEILIQQLQDEIKRLRRYLSDVHPGDSPVDETFSSKAVYGDVSDAANELEALRSKLKSAASHIRRLASEKQVLTELSNRMRAELRGAGLDTPAVPKAAPRAGKPARSVSERDGRLDGAVLPGEVSRTMANVENKLAELERLQANISRQRSATETDDEPHVSSLQTQSNKRYSTRPHSGRRGSGEHLRTSSFSTLAGDSVRDVFRLLDEGPSLADSIPQLDRGPSDPISTSSGTSSSFKVKGRTVPIRPKERKNVVLQKLHDDGR